MTLHGSPTGHSQVCCMAPLGPGPSKEIGLAASPAPSHPGAVHEPVWLLSSSSSRDLR